MTKYAVTIFEIDWETVEVDAESEEQAIQELHRQGIATCTQVYDDIHRVARVKEIKAGEKIHPTYKQIEIKIKGDK